MENAFCSTSEQVLEILNTSKNGLSTNEAKERLQKNGKNIIQGKKAKSQFAKFLAQFKDVLILVLIVSCIVSVIIGIVEKSYNEFIDAGIILLVVLINAVIGYIQERKSEQAMLALKNMTKPYCKVIRGGVIRKIKSEDVVVGDIVVIEAGDIVPADLRLIETKSLKIEESALTGESVAVEKDSEAVLPDNAVLGDRINMAYMGSVVTYGRGQGVVTAVGMQTQMGKIASVLNETKDETTPLTKRIKATSVILTIIVLIVAVIIFIVGVATGSSVFSSFSMAIAIAVCAIPEGLPACVTITMSMGVKKMSEQRAIVKKLPAVETLGSTEVICSDKTGTLTLNQMTIKKFFTFDDTYEKVNQMILDKNKTDDFKNVSRNMTELFRCMVLCNDVQIKLEDDVLQCIGDPTEVALVRCGYFFGVSKDNLEGAYPRVGEVPFDSDRKMMSTINMVENKKIVYTKGALDSILSRCDRVMIDGKIKELTQKDKNEIIEQNHNFASQALRVLAFAFKTCDENIRKYTTNNTENNLCFLGLVGMIDPPREEVSKAINTCKQAGITTIMITGDHKDTAFAIAKELGICNSMSHVITGEELNTISDEEFVKVVQNYQVYARVSPEHKVKIVKALQANNKIVAMTGDGVNDAPSIKIADIGVGMGITGTDVTKEAADIILTDDNFATIVGAVKEGRKIYRNILKILEFLLGTSFAELIAVAIITCVFRDHQFFTPALLLWINFVSDTFVGLALGFEKAEKDVMKRKPHKTTGNLFKGNVGFNIFCSALFVSIMLLTLYCVTTFAMNLPTEVVTTICFIFLVFVELLHSYNLKNDSESLFKNKIFDNKVLNWGFLASALLTVIVILLPIAPIQNAMGICFINWWQWLLALGCAVLILPYIELIKLFVRIRQNKKAKDKINGKEKNI